MNYCRARQSKNSNAYRKIRITRTIKLNSKPCKATDREREAIFNLGCESSSSSILVPSALDHFDLRQIAGVAVVENLQHRATHVQL